MNAGNFDKRFTFLELDQTVDDYGGVSDQWVKYAVRWGFLENPKATESFSENKDLERRDYTITIRYDETMLKVDGGFRIQYNDRTFEVLSTLHDERDFIFISCREYVGLLNGN